MRKLYLVLVVLLILILGCPKKEEKLVGEQGGKIVIGTTELLTTISPLAPSMFESNDILDLLFMHLHRINPETGKMTPELAISWEFSEDLSAITYYLRKDVVWWDGEPVTAEDVLYTYEKMKDPATNYPDIARLRFIKNVEVLGPYAIKFTFEKVYADLLTDSDIMPVPKHIYEKVGSKFGQAPVGNGPYKIKEWVPGSGLVLYANDAYYRGKPPLDTIYIQYFPDVAKMYESFKNGNLDMVLNLSPDLAKALEKNKNIKIDSKPGNTYTYIGWNLKAPYLKDKEIRKALTMAINTKKILKDVFADMGTISLGPLTPSSWGYNDNIKPITYNLSQAKKILEKRGFRDWNRNKIYDQNRKDFILTIITNIESPERVQILESIKNDLRALGVKVNARILDTKSFITALINRDFDGFIMGWSVGDKIDPAIYWHSDSKKGRFNFVAYKNTVVDSLIDLGVAMLDRKKAKKIWHEFQKVIYEDIPYTFLVVANKISAVHKRVHGVDKGVQLANAYTYWIPEAERRVVVASLPPAVVDTSVQEEKPAAAEKKPSEEEKKLETLTQKKPAEVKPEALLEAAVKKETTATNITPPDTTEIASAPPVAPPKPSVITRATPIKQVMPTYPDAARAVGANGRIVVRVVVGTDGTVKSATVISSFGNPACESAALAAAKKWVFKPATKDGVPFEQKVSIPFSFKP